MKAKRNYDLSAMTFDILGHTFSVISDPAMFSNDAIKRCLLRGAYDTTVDSCSTLTIKDGYTAEQRMTKMIETCAAINDGTYRKVRAERIASKDQITKAEENVALIFVKVAKAKCSGDWSEINAAEAEVIKKYDQDLYNDWLEFEALDEEDPDEVI
jgi:hypothetical protein